MSKNNQPLQRGLLTDKVLAAASAFSNNKNTATIKKVMHDALIHDRNAGMKVSSGKGIAVPCRSWRPGEKSYMLKLLELITDTINCGPDLVSVVDSWMGLIGDNDIDIEYILMDVFMTSIYYIPTSKGACISAQDVHVFSSLWVMINELIQSIREAQAGLESQNL